MSLCGPVDGCVLVHRGTSPGSHCNAACLPFSDYGDSSLQAGLPPILP